VPGRRGPQRQVPLGDGPPPHRGQLALPRGQGLQGRHLRLPGLYESPAELGPVLQGAPPREEFHLLGVVLRGDEAHEGTSQGALERRLHTRLRQEEAGRGDAGQLRLRHLPHEVLGLGARGRHHRLGRR
jgi:hypothetical protein